MAIITEKVITHINGDLSDFFYFDESDEEQIRVG